MICIEIIKDYLAHKLILFDSSLSHWVDRFIMAPKAKRSAAPKVAAMNEETQIATRNEYKKLHNKLCFLAKNSNDPDKKSQAQLGLQKLSEDRNTMLQKFKDDMSLSWLSSLSVVSTASSSTGTHGETEWLNRFQMISELKLQDAPADLVEAELERYPNQAHDNPVWAAQGQKKYQYTRVKVVEDETDRKDHVQQDQAIAPKPNKRKAGEVENNNSNPAEVQVNYKVLIKNRILLVFFFLHEFFFLHNYFFYFWFLDIFFWTCDNCNDYSRKVH